MQAAAERVPSIARARLREARRGAPEDRLLDQSVFLGIGRSPTFPFPQHVAEDEHRTVYFDVGEGPAVVLVHGLGANLTHFQALAEDLAREHRVSGLDLVGCGWSAKPDVPYTVDLLRDHLLAFLDRRGIDRATLVGHSMGGAVVLAAALARPGLADGLVLIDAAGVAPLPLWMRASSRLLLRREILVPILGLGAEFILDNVFVDSPESNPHVRWFHESSLRDAPGAPNLREFARVCETLCRDLVRRDFSSQLRHLHAPVLAIWGDHDRLTTMSGALRNLGAIPRFRTVIMRNCGHMPMVERPAETLFHLRRFLQSPPARVPIF